MPPMITTQPQNTDYLVPGDTAVFTVAASGDLLSYQWQANSTNITDVAGISDGTNTSTFTISNVMDGYDTVGFACIVTNPAGSVTSDIVWILLCELHACIYIYI